MTAIKEKSLSPVIYKKKEGVSIAPLKYSHMSTEDLEKLLWNKILLNPQIFINNRFLMKKGPGMEKISYTVIDKNLHGVKMINKKNQSRRRFEEEMEERNRPNVFTYSPDDRKIKNRLPLYTIPKGKKGDRTPSPDRRKALIIDFKLTKKNARKVAILPEHNITDK